MDLRIGYSKPYLLLGICFLSIFAGVWYSFGLSKMPPLMAYGVPAFSVCLILVCLKNLLINKIVIEADARGIIDHRLRIGLIRWEDIRAFRHVPRTDDPPGGRKSFSLFDAWRPIQLWVKTPPDSLFVSLYKAVPFPPHPDHPQAFRMMLDFSGLDVPSARLVEVMRQRAPQAEETVDLAPAS